MIPGAQIAAFFSLLSSISLAGVRFVFGIASVALLLSLALHRFALWLFPRCPPPLSQVFCGVVLALLAHWMLGLVPVVADRPRSTLFNGEVLRRLLLGQRLEAETRETEPVPTDKRRQGQSGSAAVLSLILALATVGLLVTLWSVLQCDTGSMVPPGSDAETSLPTTGAEAAEGAQAMSIPTQAVAMPAALDGSEPYHILQSQIVELQAALYETRRAWQQEVAGLKREVYQVKERVEQVAAERAIAEASIAALS